MKTINPLDYVDDEFQDIYRWIGVDAPTDADDDDRPNSRGKQENVKDAVIRFEFPYVRGLIDQLGFS